MTHNTTRPGFVATLASLGSQFTEQSTDVWCTFADKPAGTNFDGATYFCQYCGATDHLAAQAHAAADAYDAAVARIAPRDRRVKRNDPFAAGGLLSELSVSHHDDQN